MIRTLAFFILIAFSVNYAHSQVNAKEIVSHGNAFSLSRSLVVVSDKWAIATADEVVKILNDAGFSAKTTRRVNISSGGRIVLEKVKTIEGVKETNALQIKVSKDKITIRYTTEQSRKKALEYFRGLIAENNVRGYDIKDWDGVVSVAENDIDASSRLLAIDDLEAKVKQSKKAEVYVSLVDSQRWRLESSVFTIVNPQVSIYAPGGYYKMAQIATLIDKLGRSRITVIPVIELLSVNNSFERVTGHSQYSVEGMRFVRAVIEEYSEKLRCKKICIGTQSAKADRRYIEFLNDIAQRCGVELVIK